MKQLAVFFCLLLGACDCGGSFPTRDAGPEDSDLPDRFVPGDTIIRPDNGTSPDGGDDGCLDRATWIYVVDSNRDLIRFEPDSLNFVNIGRLSCPSPSSPFSMSVDRNARARVLYADGNLFDVSTVDASCTATSFQANQPGFNVFGMGYVSNSAGSEDETLFVAGGSMSDISTGTATLGRIDADRISSIGAVPGWPELTGTGAGELFGFFPQNGATPPKVLQVNKATGAAAREFALPGVATAAARAWAFAFWGGQFYIFLQTESDSSTNVYRLNPETGVVENVVPNTGRRIVGAGVSTCAPTDLI